MLAASGSAPNGATAEMTRIRAELERNRTQDREVQEDICAARRVLGKEVVRVFGVRPAGSLNEDVSKTGMEMEIAGLDFPSPARFTGQSFFFSSSSSIPPADLDQRNRGSQAIHPTTSTQS